MRPGFDRFYRFSRVDRFYRFDRFSRFDCFRRLRAGPVGKNAGRRAQQSSRCLAEVCCLLDSITHSLRRGIEKSRSSRAISVVEK